MALSQQLFPSSAWSENMSQPASGCSQNPIVKAAEPTKYSVGPEGRKRVLGCLRETFHHQQFRHMQELATTDFIAGNDVLLISPTGSGKSLCYFIPTVLGTWTGRVFDNNGFTVVISPLLALIEDQMARCEDKNIRAVTFSGGISQKKIGANMDYLMNGTAKILFTTPEKLKDNSVYDFLYNCSRNNLLKRFVIDECHCVTMWGPEFREDYRDVGSIRNRLSEPLSKPIPMMATTATLTPSAKADVIDIIFGNANIKVISSTFRRPNISYNVIPKTDDIVTKIKEFGDVCGIVYCMTQNETEKMDQLLKEKGIKSTFYHAGIGGAARKAAQKEWTSGNCRVICATVALGMGIDKSDVRFIVHKSMPMSLENYYQETGRAGRDGEPARCVLVYDPADVVRLRRMIEEKKRPLRQRAVELQLLRSMESYCVNTIRCRTAQLLQYFNERFDNGQCDDAVCDNCRDTRNPWGYDITSLTKACVAVTMHGLHRANQQGILKTAGLISILRGTVCHLNQEVRNLQPHKFPFWGAFKQLKPDSIQHIIRLLISMGYLQEFMYRETENVNNSGNLFIKLDEESRKLNNKSHKVIMFSKSEYRMFERTRELVALATLADHETADIKDIREKRTYAKEMTEQEMANLIHFCPTTVADVRRIMGHKDGLKKATCLTIMNSLRYTRAFKLKQHLAGLIHSSIKEIPANEVWNGVPLLRKND